MLSFSVFDSPPLAYFLAGVLSAFVGACLWHFGRFLLDLRATRLRTIELAENRPHDARSEEAWKCVRASRNRLRLNPNPNPEWFGPLIEEIPRLAREIAFVYYPGHPEPLHAPKVSEFARAVQFASMDIAEMLQSKPVGRLIDISAGKTVQAWRAGNRVWKDANVQKARRFLEPVYKFGKPVLQVLRFNSPLTWISVATSNAAVRTIQPAIINIVARHAIDLYSGRLANAGQLPAVSRARDAASDALEIPESAEVKAETREDRRKGPAKKRRFWRKKDA